jgi:peptidoglycan/xylan/chitin deacetylase (PgdA/CDA1 family)
MMPTCNNTFRSNAAVPLMFAFAALALLGGCGTINRSRQDMGIPRYVILLSFDDGPNVHGDTTARLLDVLKKHHVRALFALLGENAEHSPLLVRRIYDEGHYIINHGYSDTWAVSMEADEFRENLRKGEAAIAAALGETLPYRLYRPQGGYYKDLHEKIWREEGYSAVHGSVRIYDATASAAEKRQEARELIEKIEDAQGGLVLLHDMRDSWRRMERELQKDPDGPFNRTWIPELVEKTILYFRDKGYHIDGSEIPLFVEGIGISGAAVLHGGNAFDKILSHE